MTRRPDLFIIGAPKCGTTSLYNYLQGHPEVFIPRPKEPNFFAAERYANTRLSYPDDLDRYLALYREAGSARRIGDASTSYLESPDAPARIRDFQLDARIVAMLRDPVEMIHSLHGMRVAQGVEPKADFADALEAERRRPGFGSLGDQSSVHYRDRARYADMLPAWFATFGRERVNVIITEDMAADPEPIFVRLLEFLDIDRGYRPPTFRRYNTSLHPRSLLVARLTASLPRRKTPDTAFDHVLLPVGRLVRRLNRRRDGPRRPMDEGVRQMLREEFRDQVDRLSELLDRDLATTWWGATSPAGAARVSGGDPSERVGSISSGPVEPA